MENAVRKELLPFVSLTYVFTKKFKTSCLSVNLLSPLERETAAKNALLPMVLRRGTIKHPDMSSLAAELDGLYGARIEPIIRKKGEMQCFGLYCDFLDDAYVRGENRQLEDAAALMGEMFVNPQTRGGLLLQDYAESERKNLIDMIDAQKNDKRQYAVSRLIELMCASEPYGIDKLGSREAAEAINPLNLTKHFRTALRNSRLEIFYCGSAGFERVENALKDALSAMPRGKPEPCSTGSVKAQVGEPRYFEEALDVTQGKLAMGFRMGANVVDASYPAQLLFNAVFGGTTTSKLFMNVRERLSLCYYASSSLEKHKGIMTVSSGIEFDKSGAVRDEILRQLDACRRGETEDWEISGARRSVVTAARTIRDAQNRLEDFYLGQSIEGLVYGPEELAGLVEDVSPGEIKAAAERVRLDSVYFLKGNGGEGVPE